MLGSVERKGRSSILSYDMWLFVYRSGVHSFIVSLSQRLIISHAFWALLHGLYKHGYDSVQLIILKVIILYTEVMLLQHSYFIRLYYLLNLVFLVPKGYVDRLHY